MKLVSSFYLTAFFLFSLSLGAALKSGENSYIYRGMRPLGMGGAHIAVADDYNALFYNPAGLNNIQSWRVEIFNVGIGISSQVKNIVSNISDLGGDVADIAGIVEESIGSNHHLSFEFVPSWVMHNFGLALVEDFKANVRVRNQAVPEVGLYAKNDVVTVVGLAGRFWDRFQIGGTLKSIYRFTADENLSALDILNDIPEVRDIVSEGQAWGIDLGVNYILPLPFKQKVGMQIADVFNTKFNLGLVNAVSGAGTPDTIGRTINLGYKIEPPAFYYLTPVVAIDFRDVLNTSKSSYIKRLYLGTEMKLPFIFTVRAGLHQGFLSLGASADFWLITLDILSYAEELGVGYQNPDRRYYLKISMGI